MAAAEHVLLKRRGAVAVLTLNRPDRLNALVTPMRRELLVALRRVSADPEARALVITGTGRGFCAGADFAALPSIDPDNNDEIQRETEAIVRWLRTSPVPSLAAINGAVAGVGLAYALLCDVRFAAPEATFCTAFARLGLVAELGMSWTMSRLAGPGRAMDLLLSARKFSGADAAEYGLVQRLCPLPDLLDEAVGYAATIAENSAFSVARIRAQVHRDADRGFDASYEEGWRWSQESLRRPEFRSAVEARQTKGRR